MKIHESLLRLANTRLASMHEETSHRNPKELKFPPAESEFQLSRMKSQIGFEDTLRTL